MPLPAYQVVVLDNISASVQGVFDITTFYDMKYSRALNDIGALAMTLPSTPDIRAMFALDTLVEVYRANEAGVLTFEETYLVRLTHRYIEGDEERLVVGGLSLNHLISRRLVDPDDDPAVAGGYSTKDGRASRVMNDYCNEQIGPGASASRKIPTLSLLPDFTIGGNVGQRLRHDPLFKTMQTLAKQGAVDFQVRRTTGINLQLFIGAIGNDHTRGTNEALGRPWVGLSPKRGNLTQPSLLVDRQDEQNFIYGFGQGQRDKRIVYKAAGAGVTDSPWNRIEFGEDIRNIKKDDVLGLITGSEATLKEKAARTEFTFQPTGQEPGNKYRVDWDLGDAVTADWDETSEDLRITKAEITLNVDGEQIAVTVSNDFAFPGTIPYYGVLPKRATSFFIDEPILVSGTAPGAGLHTSELYNAYGIQSTAPSPQNGDSVSHSVYLQAGSYTFSVLGITDTNRGKLDWYIDGVLVVSGQDWYTGIAAFNVIKTATVTVTGDGKHVLRMVVNGKNASSPSYYWTISKVWFKQLVD